MHAQSTQSLPCADYIYNYFSLGVVRAPFVSACVWSSCLLQKVMVFSSFSHGYPGRSLRLPKARCKEIHLAHQPARAL
jgi:hypothetical protein